jgi:ferritin
MLNPKIQDALNEQVNAELYSAYLYLSMSAYFESQNLAGMANWMRIQAREEMVHVMRFYDFINQRDGQVILTQIDAPKTSWNSALEVFQEAYEHECKVSGLINQRVDLAIGEKDHAANTFLQWFVTEQVEEEATAQSAVDKLKLAADNSVALLMLDAELGQRALPAPTTA